MSSLEDSFRAAMNLLPVVVYMGLSEMIRPILAREVEERLGRRLTYEEWSFYLREYHRKREGEHRQQIVGQRYQQLVDRQIIHDFVWGKAEDRPSSAK